MAAVVALMALQRGSLSSTAADDSSASDETSMIGTLDSCRRFSRHSDADIVSEPDLTKPAVSFPAQGVEIEEEESSETSAEEFTDKAGLQADQLPADLHRLRLNVVEDPLESPASNSSGVPGVQPDSEGSQISAESSLNSEDSEIGSDDDSLLAQYAALLPTSQLPTRYVRRHREQLSPPVEESPSMATNYYMSVETLNSNDQSQIICAAPRISWYPLKSARQTTQKLVCIKVYRDCRLSQAAIDAEVTADERIKHARQNRKPGCKFLMRVSRSIGGAPMPSADHGFVASPGHLLVMELMMYPLSAIILDEPWALNRVKETTRLVAQMALGIAALHGMGIIHRNITPKNVLVDRRGNIKISDFVMSKVRKRYEPYLSGELYTRAYAGTWPYVAPEVLDNCNLAFTNQLPYGMEVDYWSLGCIVFELESVYGDVMFSDRERFDTWCRIGDNKLKAKKKFLESGELRPDAISLVCGLVHPDAFQRLTFHDVLHHPYFGKTGRVENSAFYYLEDRAQTRPYEDSMLSLEVTSQVFKERKTHFRVSGNQYLSAVF
ncbi:kinase-like domain-containing protein [Crassisporium funariophilum]|nr:kinase-like domain-containing protein [Crassisporium funariophilum]